VVWDCEVDEVCEEGFIRVISYNLFFTTTRPSLPKEGFEPLSKPLANLSCVPAVASGQAERARGLTDYEGKPLSVRVLVKFTKLSCVLSVASGKAERALKGEL